jgi:AcrR family transcriptional regulator
VRPVKEPDLTSVAERDEDSSAAKASKSEQTRTLIVETALRLFRENGYDRTTMRAIAKEAGVSVGNAYYYFASKEHLIQGFYERIQQLHLVASQEILAAERDFGARLRGVLSAWLDIADPYHDFATQFFRNAADPASPLSPFSEQSGPSRDAVIALHREVLAGSTAKVDREMLDRLPELMWLYHMGIVLYWVHDRSEHGANSRLLVDKTASMAGQLVRMARFRVFRSVVLDGTSLLRDFGLRSTSDGPSKE